MEVGEGSCSLARYDGMLAACIFNAYDAPSQSPLPPCHSNLLSCLQHRINDRLRCPDSRERKWLKSPAKSEVSASEFPKYSASEMGLDLHKGVESTNSEQRADGHVDRQELGDVRLSLVSKAVEFGVDDELRG